MSQSSRADVVRTYLERATTFDVDGDEELVTDDFLYRTRPKPTPDLGLGDTDGIFDKVGYREYLAAMAARFTFSSITIDNLTEVGDTIIVKVTLRYSYFAMDIGELVNDEAPWNGVFTFSGNKIKIIDAVPDPDSVARYLSHLI